MSYVRYISEASWGLNWNWTNGADGDRVGSGAIKTLVNVSGSGKALRCQIRHSGSMGSYGVAFGGVLDGSRYSILDAPYFTFNVLGSVGQVAEVHLIRWDTVSGRYAQDTNLSLKYEGKFASNLQVRAYNYESTPQRVYVSAEYVIESGGSRVFAVRDTALAPEDFREKLAKRLSISKNDLAVIQQVQCDPTTGENHDETIVVLAPDDAKLFRGVRSALANEFGTKEVSERQL